MSSFNRRWAVWIALWAAVAAALPATAATLLSPSPPEDRILAARGDREASLAGVTVRVLDVSAGASETVVRVLVSGRDADGDTVNLLGRSAIVLPNALPQGERSGQSDGRLLTLRFDPLPGGLAGDSVEVQINGLALSRKPIGQASDSDRSIIGSFGLRVSRTEITTVASQRNLVDHRSGFGPGAVRLTEIVQDPDVTVVRGRLEGFSPEQLQDLGLGSPVLLDRAGRSVEWVSSRSGFGPGLADFELRFRRAPGGSATLTIQLKLVESPNSADHPGRGALRAARDAQAAFVVSLPE